MFIESFISLPCGDNNKEYMSSILTTLDKLGYGGAFIVNKIENRAIEEGDVCNKSSYVYGLSSRQESLFVREPSVTTSSDFRLFSRLSLTTERKKDLASLNENACSSYDIISIKPMNQDTFDKACESSLVDIIEIPLSEKLPFKISKKKLDIAIQKGVYFEICVGDSLRDRFCRKYFFQIAKLLLFYTHGRNVLFGCDPANEVELKSSHDYHTLARLLGLSFDKAQALIAEAPMAILAHAEKRKVESTGVKIVNIE